MSVSHPLLKQLKGHVYELRKDAQTEVRDHHPTMLPLCHTLEEIFQAGLKTKLNTPFGLMRKDYWFWVQFLYEQRDKYRMPYALVEAIESVQNSKKVHTNLGRGRLFLRTALVKKVLPNILKLLMFDEIFLFSSYDPSSSILGNEIMCEILSSLLHELNKIDFKLELKNASFLDETWNLGVYKKFEFVPCKEMGITFVYARGRVIVVKVEEGSVAAEENQIEPGDVLDELYGQSLYRCSRGLISSLANKYRGLPIYLSVVKGFYVGSIYSPLKPIFEKLHLKKAFNKKEEEKPDYIFTPDSGTGSLKFNLSLLARFRVNSDEKAENVDNAIIRALEAKWEPEEVIMYVTEREIKMYDKDETELLVHKHFSEISACGRKKTYPDVFAFIFGNTTCTIAEEFRCFVLRATSPVAIATILELIG
ncbi:RUN and FYVE domain-containing protein 4 [Argiope bruennichi]|uniref:RUN and FYVE domain-containing protein 4 n=1 Tax=Argiope bruennichi TaxID=94029 RepID=A0A8T0E6Y0_ARGBR|nr:RUN and FYVE domain-containing protein 4 [Argiope bruennichi]